MNKGELPSLAFWGGEYDRVTDRRVSEVEAEEKRQGSERLCLIPRSVHQSYTLNFGNTLLNEAATPHRYLWSFNLSSPAVTAGNQD